MVSLASKKKVVMRPTVRFTTGWPQYLLITITTLIFIFSFLPSSGQSTAAYNVSIITDNFYMMQLDRYRRIWIYLPPHYTSTNTRYPVLYMQDGQGVFDASTNYYGEWKVDETLNALIAEGDPGIIVVAIDNGEHLRAEEYLPWINPTHGGGGGDIYVDFIITELKPYIDTNYRTLPDRDNTGVMGSSFGGLISLYAGIEHQEVFSKVGAFSPSYWVNPEAFDHVSSTGKKEDMKIYQVTGTLEGSSMTNNMFAMDETLHTAGFANAEIYTVEKIDGEHSEWFWAREFEAAYLWLFQNIITHTNELATNSINSYLYPNPVKDLLTLKFHLSEPAEVWIEIIDSSGKFNKRIYTDNLQGGEHLLNLNIQQWKLLPGIYLCRLHFGLEAAALKFIIIK
jgi:predicted alpha/beta superfamily hydrolase